MGNSHFKHHLLLALCLTVVAACGFAQAQSAKDEYQPQVGQEGKDVIWVPTPQTLVDKMLDMAKVTAKDHVIDLGSGDGRTVITAAKRGAIALGIEYNPDMVELSKRNAAKEGVSAKATFPGRRLLPCSCYQTSTSSSGPESSILSRVRVSYRIPSTWENGKPMKLLRSPTAVPHTARLTFGSCLPK